MKTVAEERRGDDRVENCQRGEIDRARCPEGQRGSNAGLRVFGQVIEKTVQRHCYRTKNNQCGLDSLRSGCRWEYRAAMTTGDKVWSSEESLSPKSDFCV